MQCLEVSGAVRPIYGSLGVKRLSSYSRQHNIFITTNNRTTCFDRSLSHLQVLNMLQVLESCAHIWDPSSVYIEPSAKEWPLCKHYWDPKCMHSSLKLVTY